MNFPDVDRNVLITGCSSGIGLATALYLRERGWQVIPSARKDRDLDMLKGRGFEPVRLDVADTASVCAAADEALRRFDGRPGALVNNAGFGQPGAMEDLSRETMRRQFEVNVLGLQELTNRFIPFFRRLGRGRIVNISSVLGRMSLPFMGIYSASKYAVEAMSDALRVELWGSGIAVVLVEPGPIATSFGDHAAEAGEGGLDTTRSVFGREYRRQMERHKTKLEKPMPFTRPPEACAAKIHHALVSARPRTRYKVTVVAHVGALMARLAPDSLMDFIVRQRASWQNRAK